MRVRQDDGFDLVGGNGRRLPVALAPFFLSLEEAAVDEDRMPEPVVLPEMLSRCLEPVTVPAAPRNWMYAISLVFSYQLLVVKR